MFRLTIREVLPFAAQWLAGLFFLMAYPYLLLVTADHTEEWNYSVGMLITVIVGWFVAVLVFAYRRFGPPEGIRTALRFSIRDLLWLTIVVAVGLAWFVDRNRLAKTMEGLQIEAKSERLAKEWLLDFAKQQRDRANSLQKQLDSLGSKNDQPAGGPPTP